MSASTCQACVMGLHPSPLASRAPHVMKGSLCQRAATLKTVARTPCVLLAHLRVKKVPSCHCLALTSKTLCAPCAPLLMTASAQRCLLVCATAPPLPHARTAIFSACSVMALAPTTAQLATLVSSLHLKEAALITVPHTSLRICPRRHAQSALLHVANALDLVRTSAQAAPQDSSFLAPSVWMCADLTSTVTPKASHANVAPSALTGPLPLVAARAQSTQHAKCGRSAVRLSTRQCHPLLSVTARVLHAAHLATQALSLLASVVASLEPATLFVHDVMLASSRLMLVQRSALHASDHVIPPSSLLAIARIRPNHHASTASRPAPKTATSPACVPDPPTLIAPHVMRVAVASTRLARAAAPRTESVLSAVPPAQVVSTSLVNAREPRSQHATHARPLMTAP
jgi:hypothetical protein